MSTAAVPQKKLKMDLTATEEKNGKKEEAKQESQATKTSKKAGKEKKKDQNEPRKIDEGGEPASPSCSQYAGMVMTPDSPPDSDFEGEDGDGQFSSTMINGKTKRAET